MILKGKVVADQIIDDIADDIQELKENSIIPALACVRIGNQSDDVAYQNSIIKCFEKSGAIVKSANLPESCAQLEFDSVLDSLNKANDIHGILVFRPLPSHLSIERFKAQISETKDVDCLGINNIANVFLTTQEGYPPCTPQAVMELLDFYNIGLEGKKVTIVGRSAIVGKPLAMLLISRNATVTICHTKTRNIAEECKNADILISCVGVANFIDKRFVSSHQTVIDVGINVLNDKIFGDVNYEEVNDSVASITPVPGGIGKITTAVILKHTVKSALENLK